MTDGELKEFDKDFNKIKITPQNNTILDVINKVYDENIVSNWLSFIFNPNENGIGNKPVEILLNSVGCEYSFEDGDFQEISREEYIEEDTKKGRIDIVIKYSNLWIVIENKIYSSENDKQTAKYFNYIEKKRNGINVEYIYLRPDWNNKDGEPAKKFDGKEGFKNLFYSKLINQLKKVNYFDYKEPEKFEYLKEFIKIGEKYYMGEEIKITEDMEIYIKHKKNIKELEENYKKINDQIFTKLENSLKEGLKKNNTDNYCIRKNKTYWQIIKNNWKKVDRMHYEILCDNFNFQSILGEKNVKIFFDIHIEGNAAKNENIGEIIMQMKEDSIKILKKYRMELIKDNTNKWFRLSTDKYYNFENEKEIENSINEIVDIIVEIDKKYKEKMDEWAEMLLKKRK